MLALEVELLLGRYSATDFRDRDRPEWPPHPSRLFSALLAASYEAGLGESARAALLWLESQAPPEISASGAAASVPVTAYVPVNDPADDYLPDRMERQPRSFPSMVPERPTVYFIWPLARPDATLAQVMSQIAESVAYLGSSRSPVRVRLCDHPPAATWAPDEAGKHPLRVPGPGRLERLEWHYASGLRPPAGAFQPYARTSDRPREGPEAASVFGEMIVFRLGGPPRMEIETALKLTDAMRSAVLALAGEGGTAIPDALSGHGAHPHVACVALPFVDEEQQHADGHILGLAAVLPRGMAYASRRPVLRALARLNSLDVPGVGRLGLEPVTAQTPSPAFNLRAKAWTKPAHCWTSATPVLLDRFPKKGGRGVEDIVARGCGYVGLPRPKEVVVSRYSLLYGAAPSGRFPKVRRGGDTERLSTHVTLTFDRPVQGPVLLGAGRYFGLGLLRPLGRQLPRGGERR